MVYVVDDDDGVRDSLKLLLESFGMTVETFAATDDFVRAYQPGPCACLVLDQHLPGMTGLDFLESSGAEGLRLPVILITGRGDAALRQRALAAGVASFIDKPIGENVLVAAIERAVGAGPTG